MTALCELSAHFDLEPKLGIEEGDRFEILTTLIEDYEIPRSPNLEPATSPLILLRE